MSNRVPVGCLEAWCQFTLSTDPEPMYTSLGIELVIPAPGPNQTDTDAILNIMIDRFKAMVANDYTVGPGHCVWGNIGGDTRIDGSMAGEVGTNGTEPLPQNSAILIRKSTGQGGRRAQGRLYVPGLDNTDVAANGSLTAAAQAALQTQADGLLTDLNALAVVDNVVLLHNSAPFDPSPILSLTVQKFLATQRRRMRR